jgi:hypothetical protein
VSGSCWLDGCWRGYLRLERNSSSSELAIQFFLLSYSNLKLCSFLRKLLLFTSSLLLPGTFLYSVQCSVDCIDELKLLSVLAL